MSEHEVVVYGGVRMCATVRDMLVSAGWSDTDVKTDVYVLRTQGVSRAEFLAVCLSCAEGSQQRTLWRKYVDSVCAHLISHLLPIGAEVGK